jgi:hypothetical protein
VTIRRKPQRAVGGISTTGDSAREWDINLGTGQGPSDDLNEVIISWVHTLEAETRHEERRIT